MADKLRTTYPLKIKFYEGEQPTALKLSAISSQAKSGLHIIEKAVGDLWGNGGDAAVDGLQIPTLGRVLGENKYLNPALYSLYNDDPFYYIEQLNVKHLGNTTGYLTFVPYGGGGSSAFDIVFGNSTNPGAAIAKTSVASEDLVVLSTDYWIDSVNGGTTSRFRFGSKFISTNVYIGYWVNPGDWNIASDDIVPGVIPDPRGLATDGSGTYTFSNFIPIPVTGGTQDYQTELPLRIPLDSIGSTDYDKNLPFQLPTQLIHQNGGTNYDLNSDEGKSGHPAFTSTFKRLWAYTSSTTSKEYHKYSIPILEGGTLSQGDKIPDGTLYLCYGNKYQVIEGLEFYKGGSNSYTVDIKDTAGLLLKNITDNPDSNLYSLITCGPSLTKRLWALDNAFSHHTHDGVYGENQISHSSLLGNSDSEDSYSNIWEASSMDDDDHIQYLHRDGSVTRDSNKGAMLRDLIISQTTGSVGTGNLTNRIYFGDNNSSNPSIYGDSNLNLNLDADVLGTGKIRADDGVGTDKGFGFSYGGPTGALSTPDYTGIQFDGGFMRLNSTSGIIAALDTNEDDSTSSFYIVSDNHSVSNITDGTTTAIFKVTSNSSNLGDVIATGSITTPYIKTDKGNTASVGYGFGTHDIDEVGFQYQDTGSPLTLAINTHNDLAINLDTNGTAGGSNKLAINDGGGNEVFSVNENGYTTIGDDLTVEGDTIWLLGSSDSTAPRMKFHHSGNHAYTDWETGNYYWRYDTTSKLTLDSSGNLTATGFVEGDQFRANTGDDPTDGYTFDTVDDSTQSGIQLHNEGDDVNPVWGLTLNSTNNVYVNLDTNYLASNGNNGFYVTQNNGSSIIFQVLEDGNVTSVGKIDAPYFTADGGTSAYDGYGFDTASPDEMGIQKSSNNLEINADEDVNVYLNTSAGSSATYFTIKDKDSNQVFYIKDDGQVQFYNDWNTWVSGTDIGLNAGGHIFVASSTIDSRISVTHRAIGVDSGQDARDNGFQINRAGTSGPWNILKSSQNNLNFCYNGGSVGFLNDTPDINEITGNFTGQHTVISEDSNIQENINDHVGLIVSSTGSYRNIQVDESGHAEEITINQALPMIALSVARNDKKIFGVISDAEDPNEDRTHNSGVFVSVLGKVPGDDRIVVNSLGEGAVWICNIGGPLFNGDYITTSEVSGLGMLQGDDFLHSYTVAKITCDCDFNLNSTVYKCEEFQFNGETYKKAFVGCTYHCG